MEFPEDFNQLELLNSHGHLIPRGASSMWTGSKDEEEEDKDEEYTMDEMIGTDCLEERLLQKEKELADEPKYLMLWAAQNNRLSVVARLLTADPALADCSDDDGYTPLHRAAYSGHVGVVSALISGGSKVNPRTIDGWTPLHSACHSSHTNVASVLLHHGADLNAQTNGGLTALHLAASNTTPYTTCASHTLELLLSQRNLKPELCSSSEETAFDVARRSNPNYFLFEMAEDCANVFTENHKIQVPMLMLSLPTRVE